MRLVEQQAQAVSREWEDLLQPAEAPPRAEAVRAASPRRAALPERAAGGATATGGTHPSGGGAGSGSGGSAGGSTGNGGAPKPSAGCGKTDGLKTLTTGGSSVAGAPSTSMRLNGVMSGGKSRLVIMDVPADYDATKPYRLIFSWRQLGGSDTGNATGLHPAGDGPNFDAEHYAYFGLRREALNAKQPAIFVAPEPTPPARCGITTRTASTSTTCSSWSPTTYASTRAGSSPPASATEQ